MGYMKKITRKQAVSNMQCLFDDFFKTYFNAPKEAIDETIENKRFHEQKERLRKAVYSTEYNSILGSLDSESFSKYYEKVGEFAKAYKIDMRLFTEETPALIKDINEVLSRKPNIGEKLDLINGFTDEELKTDTISFETKITLIGDLLGCWFVGDDKEQGINKILGSFTAEEIPLFMERLKDDGSLLDSLIDKVNGNEKNQLLACLYGFLSSGDGFCAEEYKLPPKAGFDAKYKKGKVIISTYYYIDRKISRYKYRYIEKNRELNPFTNVTFCYGSDQNEITVPAIVLVKSRGDVVLYDDFYKSDIDWKSLSEDKKRELYTEFVLHYLPKELGDAAVGNPITFIIMIIVGAVIAKAGAVIAACASLIGTGLSALNIIEGCKLICKSAEGYDSIYDVTAAKVSAKDLARGIALLGIEIIPVLFGLIKRGIAKYNNKTIKVGENARARTQNELVDIVGRKITEVDKDLLKAKGYEVFKRPDGSLGLKRQKGLADKIEQLSVDEDGVIIRIENKNVSKPPLNAMKGPKYNPCPDPSPCAKNAVNIIETQNQFVWVEEEVKWFSPDGTRKIWFDNGWKYDGGSGVVEEFTIVEKYSMCKTSYKTSTTRTGSFMNGHHGIQSDWADTRINGLSMKVLGGKIYFGDNAPVLLLRDTHGGTPHQYITKAQQTSERKSLIPRSNYLEQREFAIDDLDDIQCHQAKKTEYLEKADNYFRKLYNTLKQGIKDSNFTEAEKKGFSKDLENIFGDYFDK